MKKFIVLACLCFISTAVVLAEETATSETGNVPGEGCGMKHHEGKGCEKQHGNKGGEKGAMLMRLKQQDPAKFEELMKLKQDNPEEFKNQIKQIAEAKKAEFEQKKAEIKGLVDKYRESKSDADKATLRAKIEENMKNRLEKQKQKIADEENNLQTLIDKRLENIIEGKGKKCGGKDKNTDESSN